MANASEHTQHRPLSVESIRTDLEALSDASYRSFQMALMPTVDPNRVLGVRVPVLRSYAQTLKHDRPRVTSFLEQLPHSSYDEDNLHALLIGADTTDMDATCKELDIFLPYVDNWATCDMIKPPLFARNKNEIHPYAYQWMQANPKTSTYTVRYGINCLRTYLLDDLFTTKLLDEVAHISSGTYYVDMARAWFFAEALARQYDATLPLFTTPHMDAWTHNKALQKARESRRIPADQKGFLNSLKI
ncbi:MAG: DNA alkylation repair protein [Eggerthellaceae bacterium]|jgi:3-methyladenine DNA glycosylase AlkD|nr:DNA alkylation repair protein [Eggerthellaceae bacterium]MCH4220921.1 DNA alkylation repair protein [Eggerthellaceae bacterium]